MSQDEAFRRAIEEDPEDDAVRLVYADWLEEHDQYERAEFIRVQIELANRVPGDPSAERLRTRERELLDKHGRRWLGRLGELGIELERQPAAPWFIPVFHHVARFERGFIEKVSLPYTEFVHRAETLFEAAPTVRSVRLVRTSRELPSALDDVRLLADSSELSRLLTLDLARLFIGDQRVAVLLSSRHLFRLRRLELPLCSVGGAQAVAAIARNLSLTGLHTLNLSSLDLTVTSMRSLAGAKHLTNLTHLDLSRNRISDEGPVVLAGAAHLASLRTLDLEYNHISEIGARFLAESPHLQKLTALNLANNPIGAAARAALRNRFSDIRF